MFIYPFDTLLERTLSLRNILLSVFSEIIRIPSQMFIKNENRMKIRNNNF